MNEKNIIVTCLSIEDGKKRPSSIVSGCVMRNCHKCDIQVYVAPASQKLETEKEINFCCVSCFLQLLKESKKDEIKIGSVPGAIEEAFSHINGIK